MTSYYDSNAPNLAATYESLEAARLNAWFRDVLPAAPAYVLDIGAGSGRDAAWLASLGFDVVAVEPSAAMVREAQRIHPESVIHWVEGDALPGLERTLRRGQAFDFILLSAVWMHVPPVEQRRTFRKVVSLDEAGRTHGDHPTPRSGSARPDGVRHYRCRHRVALPRSWRLCRTPP